MSAVIVGLALINAVFLQEIEAQTPVPIEKYTEADKAVKFQRLQLEMYVLASDLGDGNKFLDDMETQRAAKVLKKLPFKARVDLWCTDETFGEIYRISAAYVFKNRVDASEIKDYLQANLPINKIRFAEFFLLENNHHWDKPTNDEIVIHKTFGNEQLFREVEARC